MPPARKPLTVELPGPLAREIGEIARRTRRSAAFIVRRALAAAPPEARAPVDGADTGLSLSTDEDDPPDTLAKIKSAAGKRPLDQAIAGAWQATRARFEAWAAREEAAAQAERADDLDAALADAQNPDTPLDRLVKLAASEYPKVRALIAAHPRTPHDVLQRLAQDREPYVRDAVENRRLAT